MKKIIYIALSLFFFAAGLDAQDSLRDTTTTRIIENNWTVPPLKTDIHLLTQFIFVNIGVGFGGSSIAGVDVEYIICYPKSNRGFSVQAGVGYTGFDAGVNYYLGSLLGKGYLDLGIQYRYTGFGNDDTWGYRTSNIGPVLKFRGNNKWLVAQVGAGYILDTGEAFGGSEDRKIQVHGGIGIYFMKGVR